MKYIIVRICKECYIKERTLIEVSAILKGQHVKTIKVHKKECKTCKGGILSE